MRACAFQLQSAILSAMEVGPEGDPPPVLAREVFSVGGALSRSFGIWGRNLPFFLGLALLLHLPLMFVPNLKGIDLRAVGFAYLTVVVQALLNFVITGAFTYAVVEQLRGHAVDARRTISVGLSKFVPLLGVSITTGLMIGLAALLCCVPGIILWLRWMLVAPVVVVEGKRGDEARDRSKDLTAGHRWGLFGMGALIGLISTGVGAGLGRLFGTTDSLSRRLVIQVVLTATLASFSAVLYAVSYYQLRSEKDGIDIDQLAAVFE